MFAKRQPGQLRTRLNDLQRDVKMGKVSEDLYTQQAVEILAALKKLGEKLTAQEAQFMSQHTSEALSQFQQVSEQTGASDKYMMMAKSDVEKAQR